MKPAKLDHERRLRHLSVVAAGLLALATGLTISSPSPLLIGCVAVTAVSAGVTWRYWHIVRRSNQADRPRHRIGN